MNVLCVVAHPDDEVLGCGGTLAKHAEAGDDITVIAFATRFLAEHMRQAAWALSERGYGVAALGYRDQALDDYPFGELVAELTDLIESDVVYTHNPDDLNRDHRIVSEAVQVAFRACHSQATILAFETISSTEWGSVPFAPNWFVELTKAQVDRKVSALDCYPSEIREQPHPRNAQGIYAAAKYRGAQAGVEYAEAFRLLRHHA